MKKLPLITAVMITGMHPRRYRLARIAIQCFRNQTYPNRELLIVNHGVELLKCDDEQIRELLLSKGPNETVGDLRNIGLESAQGDLVIAWDDDYWHDSRRMELQLAALRGDAAVVLKRQIRFSLVNRCGFCETVPRGIPGTIMHPRSTAIRYRSMLRGSDSVFLAQFKHRIVVDNDPALYIRFYHGLNLWDAGHIMQRYAGLDVQDVLALDESQKLKLAEILPIYRAWNSETPRT